MTTLRGSAILGFRRTSIAHGAQLHVRPPLRLGTHPGRPDTDRVWARLAVLLVKALRVINLRFRVGPWAGDRRGSFGPLDDREPGAVREVGEVDEHEHDDEHAQRGPTGEDARALREFLGNAAASVVAVEEHPGRDHHEGDHQGFPYQRELVRVTDENRTERDDLRVDVEPGPDEGYLKHHVEDESDGQDEQRHADQRMAPHERVDRPPRLNLAQYPDGRKVRAEVEHD